MSKTTPTQDKSSTLRGRLINSRLAGWIANLPLIAWATRTLVRTAVSRKISSVSIEQEKISRAAETGLEATLNDIVRDVVEALGYVGAMVATYEHGDALPVRASYIDPTIATEEQVKQWEAEVSKLKGEAVSISDPAVAVAYRYEDEFKDNLSVRAIEAGVPVASDELYDLLTPVAPFSSRPMVKGIQQALGIHQVIAVPFFLETSRNGNFTQKEVVGNLFALKRSEITNQDVLILSAFGRQAAAAIESERRRLQIQLVQELILDIQASLQDETQILQLIAEGVVTRLGYVGAMVATYDEHRGALPVRAAYIVPNIATEKQIKQWETEVSKLKGEKVSLSDPEVAVAYRYEAEHKDNLSVRALEAGQPVASDDLYDLFTPVAPPSSKPLVKGIQQALGINQVIAVPFFLKTPNRHVVTEPKIIGNLFAASRSRSFFAGEIELLEAFGQQAAIGIQNAQLYRIARDRQEVAQIFAKMAFSAAAYVHALRNHIGAFRMYSQVIKSQLSESFQKLGDDVGERLHQAADILDNLHEPWRQQPDTQTDVNLCLNRAVNKIISDREMLKEKENISVIMVLAEDLPPIKTSPDMLTEAFRVLIKNALEAIRGRKRDDGAAGNLWIESRLDDTTTIEVSIRDNGIGIKSENLSKIFEMRWSTKKTGMGFGLFWTKDYIEGLDGDIDVESIWQEETTFRIRLPAFVE